MNRTSVHVREGLCQGVAVLSERAGTEPGALAMGVEVVNLGPAHAVLVRNELIAVLRSKARLCLRAQRLVLAPGVPTPVFDPDLVVAALAGSHASADVWCSHLRTAREVRVEIDLLTSSGPVAVAFPLESVEDVCTAISAAGVDGSASTRRESDTAMTFALGSVAMTVPEVGS